MASSTPHDDDLLCERPGRAQIPVPTASPPASDPLPRLLARPSRFLTGTMDDVAIWNRALVAEEILQLEAAPVKDRSV